VCSESALVLHREDSGVGAHKHQTRTGVSFSLHVCAPL
jgi:hypothetical protein